MSPWLIRYLTMVLYHHSIFDILEQFLYLFISQFRPTVTLYCSLFLKKVEERWNWNMFYILFIVHLWFSFYKEGSQQNTDRLKTNLFHAFSIMRPLKMWDSFFERSTLEILQMTNCAYFQIKWSKTSLHSSSHPGRSVDCETSWFICVFNICFWSY